MISAFGVEHTVSKAAGRKDTVHRSQIRDSANHVAGAESWSATHSDADARDELTRRRFSRNSKLLGSYRETRHHALPGGPDPHDRPVGHLLSEYRPPHTRKRVVALAAAGAVAGTAAVAHHKLRKSAFEVPE